MALQKQIQAAGRVVTVREVRPAEFNQALKPWFDAPPAGDTESLFKNFFTGVNAVLSVASDLTAEDAARLTPSEKEELWTAFREVNLGWIKWADQMGVIDAARALGSSLFHEAGQILAEIAALDAADNDRKEA